MELLEIWPNWDSGSSLLLLLWSSCASVLCLKLLLTICQPPPSFCTDYGEHRRRLPFIGPHAVPEDVVHRVEYITNSRGSLLHAQHFLPAEQEPKGVIFLCSGYADTISWLPTDRAVRFAQAGFAVYGVDYEGAGRSDGLHVFIPCFETMVDDVETYYRMLRKRHGNVRAFLCGESMGGAVAIKLALRDRASEVFDGGCILLAPMVKINEAMKPPQIVINLLKAIVPFFPTLPAVPAPAVMDKAFRRKEVLEIARANPYAYKKKPRLATALQLLYATESVSRQIEDFRAPFLVLQGTGDMVTDPALAQEFYQRAGSKEKEIHLYEGYWHNLLSGEIEEHIQRVYADIFAWLDRRINKAGK